MVQFQDNAGRSLPRDDYFREVAELIVAIRIARVAWEAGPCHHGEWHAFATQVRSALRSGTSLPFVIADIRTWASGWWRRAHFINQRWQ